MAGAIRTPSFEESSFSGISPTERRRVSQEMYPSVPGMGFLFSSTCASVTPLTRSFPSMSITVWLSFRGMPKSSRHWTMFL